MKSREAISVPPPGRFTLGGYELDTRERRLKHPDGHDCALPPRAVDLLMLFVAHPGELLSREALIDTLWPDVVVDDNNLSQLVVLLRRALGDTGAGRVIQTVPRRGFRLLAAVARIDTARDAVQADAPSNALAVLPFRPLASTDDDEVLQVGLADTLITCLSAVPGLAVRSTASVRSFGRIDADPLDAARQLDVAWVLEGTVQRRGRQLRVNARLLRVSSGTAAWSGGFDEDADNLFAAQDAIARQVLAVAAPHLSNHVGPPAQAVPDDVMQLYLAARLHAQGIDALGLTRSVALFERAIAEAPGFALAHAGLSETLRRTVFGADADPAVVLPRARAAAARAVALDPKLAQGHATLGWVAFWFDRDWAGAETLLRHALALNPNVAEAQLGLGHLLLSTGRATEGALHLTLARRADPLSPLMNTMECHGLAATGQHDAIQMRLSRVFDIDPDFWIALLMRAAGQEAAGAVDAAMATLERAVAVSGGRTQAIAALACALARAGRSAEARHHLSALQAASSTRHVSPSALARVLAALGDREAALDQLELAVDRHDVLLAYLQVDAWRHRSLEGEPRYDALLRRVGFPASAAPHGSSPSPARAAGQ